MSTSESTENILKAIHNVQQSLEVIGKRDKADVGSYSYKYAGMTTIWNHLKPLLKQEELTVIQTPTSGENGIVGDFLQTTIYHASGEYITDKMRLVITRDDPQGFGSAITYARRYALTAMLGIVTDDDNDASTQRLADGEMKKDWVRAFTVVQKQQNPDKVPTNQDFISFMTEVYGKHPTKILAREHQQVLDTINAFKD